MVPRVLKCERNLQGTPSAIGDFKGVRSHASRTASRGQKLHQSRECFSSEPEAQHRRLTMFYSISVPFVVLLKVK